MAESTRAKLMGHGIDAVVIGGSAGSVDVLLKLVPALPEGLAVPVLVVVHLLPGHASALPGLLAARCAVPVLEASDELRVEPGQVVVAPPDHHMLIERDDTVALSVEDPVNFSRPSIDVLFESARWAYHERLLGILLTGASEDGAAGLAAIAEGGGLAWVQDPATAYAPVMPMAGLRRAAGARPMTVDALMQALGGLAR